MKESTAIVKRPVNRRSLLKGGLPAGGAAALGAGLLDKGTSAFAISGRAAELIESDRWTQYAELGGIGTNLPIEVSPNQTFNPYQAALSNLDSDGAQYIASNTLDKISHATFLNCYPKSKGADPVDLEESAILAGSSATGSTGNSRLTNLFQINVDTSWFVRCRSNKNPDFVRKC